jgi:hypothetical protein
VTLAGWTENAVLLVLALAIDVLWDEKANPDVQLTQAMMAHVNNIDLRV